MTSVGSITQADGNKLLRGGSVNSVTEALQGKLNGVVAINSGGMPGGNDVSMYIRGKSTWGNTDPLVLLDGIQSDIKDVDMNEIESISVLKDASATAVYGVRGGNGVILITTKRGTNKAPTISFRQIIPISHRLPVWNLLIMLRPYGLITKLWLMMGAGTS